MRKNFILFVLVPAVLLGIIVVLFVDGWVESGLEYAGERAVKAKVEIDGLHLSLFPIGMSWSRLQVANPRSAWENIFETRRVTFQMDAGQLLRAKFIIDTIRVEGFVLGTKRTTDGRLPVEPARTATEAPGSITPMLSEAEGALANNTKQAPLFDLDRLRRQLNLDSLTNPRNLETYRLVDSLKRQLAAAEVQWNTALGEVEQTRQQVSEVEQRVRAIDVNQITSVESAQAALKNATEAYNTTREVMQSVEARKRSITQTVNSFSADIGSLDDAARRDFQRIVAVANLPDVSMKGLAELVLGREILAQAYEYLGYVDYARKTIPKYTPKPDPNQPRRSEGINVHFPEEASYPKFWIKEILLSGGTDSTHNADYFYATGTIRNISNDQRITGQAITANLDARKGTATRATFNALFDRRDTIAHDRYDVRVSGISVGDMPLGSSGFLPSKIRGATAIASVVVDVPGSDLESSARIDFENLAIVFDRDPRNVVERLTRDVLASVRSFFVNLRLWKNESGKLDVAFATNLDDQLSGKARAVIGAEVARIRADIQQRVNARVAEKRREIEGLYNQKRREIQQKLDVAEKEIRQKIAFVEQKKKDLEDRIEQEKKKAEDAVKKKAGDLLKGILKKN